jgi:hypothetical protein
MFKVILIMVLLVGLCFAQETRMQWVYENVVINGNMVATNEGEAKVNLPGFRNAYGVTVDSTGKIWAASYYQRRITADDGSYIWPDDVEKTIKGSQGQDSVVIVGTYPVFILKTDSTLDTLRYLNWADGTVDTLFNGNRGIATHPDGSIIYAADYGVLYKIDPLTYEPLAKCTVLGSTWRTGRPDVSADGYVFTIGLFGGDVIILDEDLNQYNMIPGTTPGVSRGIGCSPDGKHVFIPSQNGGAHHYYSEEGVDGTYAFEGIIGEKFWVNDTTEITLPSTMALWDPAGLLWLGRQEAVTTDQYIMWAFDPDQDWAMVDDFSFRAPTSADTTIYGYSLPEFVRCPRDAAFSKDGMTMYIAEFYGYTIKEYHYEEVTGIEDKPIGIPDELILGQNYPNPFNPTTHIPFVLDKKAHVRLKIYDSLGREVAMVLNEVMAAGSHTYQFDGSGLATGIYYYKLTVDSQVRTGRMLLVK